MNILILMAGNNADFREKGHLYPKYLIEIQNKPLIQRTVESLESIGNSITCIIAKEDQEKYFLGDTLKIISPKCKIVETAGETKGALCTALFAIDLINNNEELLVLNGDQFVKADIALAIDDFQTRNLDGGIVAIKAIHPKYSSILLDEHNHVTQTSEKRPISDIASTGCCYFRKGTDFVKYAFSVIEKDANTQGLYYISSIFNEMILDQKKIGIYKIPKKDYISFSTYQMYENYLSRRED